MTTLREAAQQALEALRHVVRQAQENLVPTIHYGPVHDAMNRLEAALAEYDKDRVKVEEMKANWALQRKLAEETQERDKQQREYEEQRLAALAEPVQRPSDTAFDLWWDDALDGPTPIAPVSKETAQWIWNAANTERVHGIGESNE